MTADASRSLTSDDGIGFVLGFEHGERRAVGLRNMRERFADMNGDVQARERPGQGTDRSREVPFSLHERVRSPPRWLPLRSDWHGRGCLRGRRCDFRLRPLSPGVSVAVTGGSRWAKRYPRRLREGANAKRRSFTGRALPRKDFWTARQVRRIKPRCD